MTEHQSPLDAALDLLFFAPVGLALNAAEEIPKLAAKGRAQVGMARVLGQFVVAQGRKEVERRLGGAGARGAAPVASNGAATPQQHEDVLPVEEDSGDFPASGAAGEDVNGSAQAATSPSAEGLAIPGYDSLSASQVVQRLAGLSSDELAAVGAYESAHRGRRTVLTRVSQLQGS